MHLLVFFALLYWNGLLLSSCVYNIQHHVDDLLPELLKPLLFDASAELWAVACVWVAFYVFFTILLRTPKSFAVATFYIALTLARSFWITMIQTNDLWKPLVFDASAPWEAYLWDAFIFQIILAGSNACFMHLRSTTRLCGQYDDDVVMRTTEGLKRFASSAFMLTLTCAAIRSVFPLIAGFVPYVDFAPFIEIIRTAGFNVSISNLELAEFAESLQVASVEDPWHELLLLLTNHDQRLDFVQNLLPALMLAPTSAKYYLAALILLVILVLALWLVSVCMQWRATQYHISSLFRPVIMIYGQGLLFTFYQINVATTLLGIIAVTIIVSLAHAYSRDVIGFFRLAETWVEGKVETAANEAGTAIADASTKAGTVIAGALASRAVAGSSRLQGILTKVQFVAKLKAKRDDARNRESKDPESKGRTSTLRDGLSVLITRLSDIASIGHEPSAATDAKLREGVVVSNVYEDVFGTFPRTIYLFTAQMLLTSMYVGYLFEKDAENMEPRLYSLGSLISLYYFDYIAIEFDNESTWEALRKIAANGFEITIVAGGETHFGLTSRPSLPKLEFIIRRTLAILANVTTGFILLVTLPFSLSTAETPIDFVKDAIATIFILELDDLRGKGVIRITESYRAAESRRKHQDELKEAKDSVEVIVKLENRVRDLEKQAASKASAPAHEHCTINTGAGQHNDDAHWRSFTAAKGDFTTDAALKQPPTPLPTNSFLNHFRTIAQQRSLDEHGTPKDLV